MSVKRFIRILSKVIDPFRVFIALMLAVTLWLAPVLFHAEVPEVLASPSRQDCRVCADWNETCSNNGCRRQGCAVWVWEPCVGGEEPIPLAISGSVGCSVGGDGWCVGDTWLNLNASAPQGQTVIISGSVNGTAFACPAGNTTCSVPVTSEGEGMANFQVDSASGGSASNSASYKLDATPPQISGGISGASGKNGWFISEVDFSVSASDVVSGLASLEILVDGGEWQAYTDPITLGDGLHTISLRAFDHAGNMAEMNQTVSVDTLTPLLDVSVSGSAGSSGWYVSEAEVSALASDDGSGLFVLEVAVDGGAWKIYDAPVILSDGVHTVNFRATDNAGNVTTLGREVKVDTVTPSLSLSVNGTRGISGWYKSLTQTSAAASDSGSGLAVIEGSSDGGTWNALSVLSFSDGFHTWQFRARDNAGNLIESPVQNIKIDTIAPAIDMTEELSLGEALYYDLEDMGSGLSVFRVVIEDDAEQYKKISWLDPIGGNKLRGDILWDGKFKDGTKAGMGEYFITLKVSDAAGNETIKSVVVDVTLFGLFQDVPAFTPPAGTMPGDEAVSEPETPEQIFGNTNSGTLVEKTSSVTTTGRTRSESAIQETQTWATEPVSNDFALPNSNILWGAAAASLVGATLAEWQKKREAEKEPNALPVRKGNATVLPLINRRPGYQASLNNFSTVLNNAVNGGNLSAEDAGQYLKDAKAGGSISVQLAAMNQQVEQAGQDKKGAARKALEEAARQAAEAEEKRKAEELQAGLMAYYQGRKEGEVTATPQESWWDKTLNWVDNHQIGTSMGVGAIVGLAVIGITLAAAITITLPVLAVAAGIAALAAGASVAAGTVALNTYYDRPPTTNIWNNVKAASITAAVVSGVGLFVAGGLLTQAAIATGNAIAGTCVANPTVCASAGTILNAVDTLEQASLQVQLMVETATGNPHAGETALELQLELMDGGVPGNVVAKEFGEQIAKLGGDVPELIATYGDEIVPLLLQYGDEAVNIIGAYGDEGIALLLKSGDDTGQVINLVKQFGTPAVKVLDAVDPASADKLLKTLDDDALDYAIQQGPDAVAALSRWSNSELMEFGPELALRAKKDAKVLKSIQSLVTVGAIDPKHLTTEQKDLINIIAENSMQYSDEGPNCVRKMG